MTPNFTGFRVGPVPSAKSELGARKIVAWSTQPFGLNTIPRAWVGNQELSGVTIDQFGLSLKGYVENVPADTDTLHFQMPGGEKTDTGLTVTEEPGVA